MTGKRAPGKKNWGAWIPADLYDRADAAATAEGITHTDLTIDALTARLDRHEPEAASEPERTS